MSSAFGSRSARLPRDYANAWFAMCCASSRSGRRRAFSVRSGAAEPLDAFLFGVSARDPVMFTGVALVLTMLAFLAAWIAANRVVRLNVVDVLRGD